MTNFRRCETIDAETRKKCCAQTSLTHRERLFSLYFHVAQRHVLVIFFSFSVRLSISSSVFAKLSTPVVPFFHWRTLNLMVCDADAEHHIKNTSSYSFTLSYEYSFFHTFHVCPRSFFNHHQLSSQSFSKLVTNVEHLLQPLQTHTHTQTFIYQILIFM